MRPVGIKNNHGFTLAEVIVATAVFTVISSLMLMFFVQGSNIWNMLTAQSDLRSSARNAMLFMQQELRNATHTSQETPSPNLTTPTSSQVDFYLPKDIDGNGLIINALGATEWDKSNKIQYQYVPGQKRLRRLEKGVQHVIANEVTNIQFETGGSLYANELKIVLTLERTLPVNRKAIITLTSIVKLRNQ